jgi:pimeloyl-ACP methyl ester carboxylesterase
MLARWQGVLVVLSWVAALAWLVWCRHAGVGLGWTLAGTVLAFLPQAPLLALEFAMLAAWGRDAAAPRASGWHLVRAWAGEVWASWRVFGWRQPFLANREPDMPDPVAVAGQPGRTGVLLLHGYCCNRGLWAPWLRRLRARGVPCVALTMEPVFGHIDDWAPSIEAAVVDLTKRTGVPPLVVAHSMGGLAIRAWLAAQPDARAADARVRRVVTIATPHHGTWMARHAYTPNARQMRIGGRWLADLAARETAARRARFTCFFGHADNIVFPATTATLVGADNRHLAGVAHVAMAFRPEVFDEVTRLLREADY